VKKKPLMFQGAPPRFDHGIGEPQLREGEQPADPDFSASAVRGHDVLQLEGLARGTSWGFESPFRTTSKTLMASYFLSLFVHQFSDTDTARYERRFGKRVHLGQHVHAQEPLGSGPGAKLVDAAMKLFNQR
jgi:hypothetical protein